MDDFKVGDKVVVKESKRSFVKELYDDNFWPIGKRALGMLAARGEELIVKRVICDDHLEVCSAKYYDPYYLSLDFDNFEKNTIIEGDILSML